MNVMINYHWFQVYIKNNTYSTTKGQPLNFFMVYNVLTSVTILFINNIFTFFYSPTTTKNFYQHLLIYVLNDFSYILILK